ncbi:hypothetical protein CBS101457_003935 [Exobasidium rhododendri]|nr:hypothetical protein CBS101457_003935 [Exobasidium rhododendri]
MAPVAVSPRARVSVEVPPAYQIIAVGDRDRVNRTTHSITDERKPTQRAGTPLIIDNGSYELRAGFATASTSTAPTLSFENVVSKFRERKTNKSFMLAGSDCFADTQSRAGVKSAFDGDVVTNMDIMENVLDYAFLHLGINSSTVNHPILMTETLCNPTHSRTLMNELMFETYQVPSICYGLDSLFSAYQNGISDGLVISSGRNSTTLLPMLDGKGMVDFSKRLNWGGQQASEYLLKLVQLKYPAFPTRVTLPQAAWMQENMLQVQDGEQESYEEFIGRLSNPDELAKEDKILQFPFTAETKEEKSQEEVDAALEKRRENGRRLQEQAQKTRLEKMLQKENDLKYFEQVKEWKSKERKAEYFKRLESEGFKGENDLESTIRNLQMTLKKFRAKQLGEEEGDEQIAVEVPSFALVEVPDDQLDEEGVREKRKQRLLKAGYEARLRAKAEKEEERRQVEAQLEKDDNERINDPRGWASKKRREYEDTIQRIKERKRKKEMLNDRKSLAAQQRMKNITSLASDAPTGASKRKRRGGGGGGAGGGGDDDTFGADDDDWAIYREIQNDEDSDVSEEENSTLTALEQRLLDHDPTFTASDTYESHLKRKNKLTSTFLRGYYPEWDVEDVAQQHQIHLNLERSRVPEVLWKPYFAGVDQAGIDEVASFILGNFSVDDKRSRLMNNVFVTGQHTQYPNFDTRLYHSLRATQPAALPVRVVRAKDVRFDTWKGMRKWALDDQASFERASISRKEYEEKGSEWFKEHSFASNLGGE